jgi:hypothetical protein
MRRSLLTAVGIMALVLAVPSAALAHRGRGHHHHHKTKAHHAKFRIMHIDAAGTSVTGSPTGTTPPTTPTTSPTPENAGKVASYTGGVLVLTLNDGSTVSGKVTEDTRIGCVKETPTTTPGQPGEQGPGDDKGQGDDQSGGDMSQHGDKGSGEWQHDQGDGGDDDRGEVQGTPEPLCDSSALLAGAVVRAAELRIGPGGNEFENILLAR